MGGLVRLTHRRSRIARVLLAAALMLSGCNNTREIGGVTYDVYGLANQQEKQNPSIEYRVSVSSVIIAVIFSETVIVPLYVVLFDLYEPVQKMPAVKGQVG